MQRDSRKTQRFIIALPVFIESHTGTSKETNRELLSRDVSSGGAYFITPDPLDVGTRMVVTIILKPQQINSDMNRKARVTIGGKVLRKESEGMAVCFDASYKIASVEA